MNYLTKNILLICLFSFNCAADVVQEFIVALERDNPGFKFNRFLEDDLEEGKLVLEKQGLKIIPAEIGNLENLKFLNLDENKISTLPPEIGKLTNLQTLSLAGNKLSSLPDEFWQLVNIENLALHENQLTHIPAELGNFIKLAVLSLRNNKFKDLPAQIGQLPKIRMLLLQGNQFLPRGETEDRWGIEELKSRFEGKIRVFMLD